MGKDLACLPLRLRSTQLLKSQCGDLERTDFIQFLIWEGVVVLKKTDFE